MLSGPASQRIANSKLTELVVLDTVRLSDEAKVSSVGHGANQVHYAAALIASTVVLISWRYCIELNCTRNILNSETFGKEVLMFVFHTVSVLLVLLLLGHW